MEWRLTVASVTAAQRALRLAVQRFEALNSEGNAHAERECREALRLLTGEEPDVLRKGIKYDS